jgi:2-keto-4-pentenoate hydratase/2-oxohepta-3-ene-1,7-dioic acid hydratase in catechol pathway
MTAVFETSVGALLVSIWDGGRWGVALASGDALAPLDVPLQDGRSAIRALLEQGDDAVRRAVTQAEDRLTMGSSLLNRNDVRIGPTVPDPEKILCVGFNYAEHTEEMGVDRPAAPNVFAKFRNSLIADGEPVPLGTASTQIDYEGELAVVVGRRCSRVVIDEVDEYLAGYSIVNDVTARDLQFRTSQWTLGKAADGFCPLGPGLMPRHHVPDVQALGIMTRVNGRIVQNGSTKDMVFSVAEIISEISQVITLVPGDVVATGTPAGVGYKADPPRFLGDGDEVEISIEGIGTLTNRFALGSRTAPDAPDARLARHAHQARS